MTSPKRRKPLAPSLTLMAELRDHMAAVDEIGERLAHWRVEQGPGSLTQEERTALIEAYEHIGSAYNSVLQALASLRKRADRAPRRPAKPVKAVVDDIGWKR